MYLGPIRPMDPVTATLGSVLVCQMLLVSPVMSAGLIIGRLLVVKVAKPVIVIPLVQMKHSVIL